MERENEESNVRFMRHVDIGRVLEMIGLHPVQDGNQWKARCPNAKLGHGGEDRHPSWSIRDDVNHERHGIHGCWTCGYAGNVIGLVMDVLGLKDFKAARAWIQTHGMRGEVFAPLSVSIEVVETRPHNVLTVPEGVRVEPLLAWAPPYRDYWLRRGFTAADAATWGVGWAPEGHCGGRIWLPVRNVDGDLVNWTARSIDDREPRYLRATSALNPDKGTIFGECFWSSRRDVVAVSEGELNAIRLRSVFGCAVAGLGGGSKLHPTHSVKLLTFSRMVVFADGDPTGDGLTRQLRELGLPMAVVRFSKPYDPCSVSVADLKRYGSAPLGG